MEPHAELIRSLEKRDAACMGLLLEPRKEIEMHGSMDRGAGSLLKNGKMLPERCESFIGLLSCYATACGKNKFSRGLVSVSKVAYATRFKISPKTVNSDVFLKQPPET